jgi:hypothetical protein
MKFLLDQDVNELTLSITNPESVIAINQSFKVLSAHRWDIDYLHTDQYAIRVEYRITPPIWLPDEIDVLPTDAALWGHAVDNLGQKYDCVGGALEISTDKQSTQGVISFAPLPSKETASIQFFIEIRRKGKGKDSIGFSILLRPDSLSSSK